MEGSGKTYIAWGLDDGVHEARGLKPMLTPEEQVGLLKAKGVTFERCSEKRAIEALSREDTFLHIRLGESLSDRIMRYGQENSFVSHLSFIAKAIDSMG